MAACQRKTIQQDGELGQLRERENILDDIKTSGKLRKKHAGRDQTQKSENCQRQGQTIPGEPRSLSQFPHIAGLLGHSGVQGELATPRSSIDVKV